MNDDIEERINEKVEMIKTNEEKTVFNHKGNAEKKQNETVIRILNLENFDKDIHYILFDIIKNGFMKSKESFVKEFCCYNENDALVFEGVMDKTEENYFINNIVFKISGVNLVRIQSKMITIDDKPVNLAGGTMFATSHEDMMQGYIYDTGENYVADIIEAKEKNMKLLERTVFNKIMDKDKRIRYSPELGKIFIR